MKELTDSDLMPFGAYKGLRMIDVPGVYLLWLYDNNKANGPVLQYILDNIEAIKKER